METSHNPNKANRENSSSAKSPDTVAPSAADTTTPDGLAEISKSPLELLPVEIREKIYFILGVPIAGRCLHDCSEDCIAARGPADQATGCSKTHEEREAMRDGLFDTSKVIYTLNNNFRASYGTRVIKGYNKEFDVFVSAHDEDKGSETTELTFFQKRKHIFYAPCNSNLIAVNRFFYYDIKAYWG